MHPRSLNTKTQHEVRLGLSPPRPDRLKLSTVQRVGGHRITTSPADG